MNPCFKGRSIQKTKRRKEDFQRISRNNKNKNNKKQQEQEQVWKECLLAAKLPSQSVSVPHSLQREKEVGVARHGQGSIYGQDSLSPRRPPKSVPEKQKVHKVQVREERVGFIKEKT